MSDIRFTAAIIGSLEKIMNAEISCVSLAARSAVEDASSDLQDVLRKQVRLAGLGIKLEKAWRKETYPRNAASQTMRPAGLVYSKAQKLHDAYNKGGTIRAQNGSRFLAIPTKYVPRNFSPRRQMTPTEVEAQYNQDLRFQKNTNGKPGGVLVLDKVVLGKNKKKKRYKTATKRRVQQGGKVQTVVMFTLIPAATLKKTLDIEGAAAESLNKLESRFVRYLNGQV